MYELFNLQGRIMEIKLFNKTVQSIWKPRVNFHFATNRVVLRGFKFLSHHITIEDHPITFWKFASLQVSPDKREKRAVTYLRSSGRREGVGCILRLPLLRHICHRVGVRCQAPGVDLSRSSSLRHVARTGPILGAHNLTTGSPNVTKKMSEDYNLRVYTASHAVRHGGGFLWGAHFSWC